MFSSEFLSLLELRKPELTERELQKYPNVQQRCCHPTIHEKFIIVDDADVKGWYQAYL